MAIYEFTKEKIVNAKATEFRHLGFREREDLQRLLRERIDIIDDDLLVIAEEYGNWDDSRRRIDLLAVDRNADLVVLELKRTEDGGHMELQAIRYAAMVSNMTFEQAVKAFANYLTKLGNTDDSAEDKLLEHLGLEEPSEEEFGKSVRIVLVSAEFSKELTSSVLWLNERDLDIRCVRFRPYTLDSKVLVDVQQVIPLPEATEYQVQFREKAKAERDARSTDRDYTRYDVTLDGATHNNKPKRRAIYLVARYLIENGVTPEQFAAVANRPLGRLWLRFEGRIPSEEIIPRAIETGLTTNATRWYCDDDDLIFADGYTLAFSKHWGGTKWHNAMKALKTEFSQFNFDYKPVSSED